MMKFFLLTCLFAFVSKNATAFTFYVPNLTRDGGFCVSNETGLTEESDNVLAPIYDLNLGGLMPIGQRKINKGTQLSKKEGDFGENNAWDMSGIESKADYLISEEPMLDREWNFLPETVTNGTNNFQELLEMGENEVETFHVSVLADNAIFLFSKSEVLSRSEPGFLLVVDAIVSKERRLMLLKKFINIQEETMAPARNIFQEFKNVSILHGGKKWVHLTFKAQNSNDGFTLTVSYGNQNCSFEKIRSGGKGQIRLVRVRTMDTIGFFKLHQYPILRSFRRDSTSSFLQDSFTLNKAKKFCIDVVYNGEWTATLREENSGKVVTEKILSTSQEWKTERIETNRSISGKYMFKLSAQKKDMKIKDVKYCTTKGTLEIFEMKHNNKVISCQSLIKTSSSRVLVEETILKQVCKTAGNEDCKNVEACDLEGCFCLSGFYKVEGKQTCSKECKNDTFGPDCQFRSGKFCKVKNKHTGDCVGKSCLPGFRPPYCMNADLLEFVEPLETTANVHSVKVDAEKSIKTLDVDNYKNYFLRADIQIKKIEGGNDWKNGISLAQNEKMGTISGLEQNTTYKIRTLITEKDGSSTGKGPESEFTTKGCTPITYEAVASSTLDHLVKKGTFPEDSTCHISNFSVRLLNLLEIASNKMVPYESLFLDLLGGNKEIIVVFQDEIGTTVKQFYRIPSKIQIHESEQDEMVHYFHAIGLLIVNLMLVIASVAIWNSMKINQNLVDLLSNPHQISNQAQTAL